MNHDESETPAERDYLLEAQRAFARDQRRHHATQRAVWIGAAVLVITAAAVIGFYLGGTR